MSVYSLLPYIKELKERYAHLTELEILSLAVQMERNGLLQAAVEASKANTLALNHLANALQAETEVITSTTDTSTKTQIPLE